eukprot:scaffold2201_cov110-Isochrysis_galbana.AAC.7
MPPIKPKPSAKATKPDAIRAGTHARTTAIVVVTKDESYEPVAAPLLALRQRRAQSSPACHRR